MNRTEKAELVSSLKDSFANNKCLLVIHYKGLNATDNSSTRSKVRSGSATIQVAKNTLIKIAANGSIFAPIVDHLTGPTALVYSNDPASLAKTVVSLAEEFEPIKFVSGCLDGKLLSQDQLKYLSSLGSIDELRAKLLGTLNAPAGALVRVMASAGGGSLATLLENYRKAKSGE